jgi:hypothetical protein
MELKREKLGIKIEVPDLDEIPKNFILMAVFSVLLLGGTLYFVIMEILGKDIFI